MARLFVSLKVKLKRHAWVKPKALIVSKKITACGWACIYTTHYRKEIEL